MQLGLKETSSITKCHWRLRHLTMPVTLGVSHHHLASTMDFPRVSKRHA